MTDGVQERQQEGLKRGDLLAGRFEIQEMLAEGGMGRVYVAIQQPMGRKVAVKVMKHELVSDQASVKRFFREAVAVSKLSHPNTITIIDYGEGEGGNLYIAMEYLEGEPLSDIMNREGPMSLERVVNVIAQVARSLVEAHRKGVIHRDLKPENVFISNVEAGTDLVKVLDFGIAKLQQHEGTKITRLGYVCGTPEYMSPEQARGDELDGRTDVYALGVVMWEMLEGTVPFVAPTPLGIVLKHQTDPIPPLNGDIPEDFKEFVYRVMSKEPEQRPTSAEAFLDELLAVAPADLASYSVTQAKATGHSRPSLPHTPPRVRETADIATAATLPPGSAAPSTADVPAAPKSSHMGRVLLLVGGAAVLVGLGLGTMLLMLRDPETIVEEPAPPAIVVEDSTLQIEGTPPEAEIYEGDKMIGLAPAHITGHPGTEKTLTISKTGFLSATVVQSFPESGNLKVVYSLTREPAIEKVKITLETAPPGAEIKRGDDVVAQTPYVFEFEPTAEAFEVQVSLDKYAPETITVNPKAGSQTLKLPLTKAKRVRRPSVKPRRDVAPPKNTDGGDKPPKVTKPPVKPKNKYELVH